VNQDQLKRLVADAALKHVVEDRVVGVLHVSGCAKLSGITTELRYAALYTLRDDKIARIREYGDREEALEAAGLEG